jgi:hypothetical protein
MRSRACALRLAFSSSAWLCRYHDEFAGSYPGASVGFGHPFKQRGAPARPGTTASVWRSKSNGEMPVCNLLAAAGRGWL